MSLGVGLDMMKRKIPLCWESNYGLLALVLVTMTTKKIRAPKTNEDMSCI